jgi:DNA-binding GntR family transcriptional regulator
MNLLNYLRVFREIKPNRKLDLILLAEKTNLSVREIKRAVNYLEASEMISNINSKVKINVKRLTEVS